MSRHIIERYVNAWTIAIHDITPLVRKIHTLIQAGEQTRARALLPRERVYPVDEAIAKRLGMVLWCGEGSRPSR